MQLRHVVLMLIGTLLVGCSEPALEPTLAPSPTATTQATLPTAVPPEAPAGTWALPFEHAFPSGFWERGPHRYGFYINCPPLGSENAGTEWRTFEVTDEARAFDTPIYLRIAGLSTGPLAPINWESINPEQPTVAVVTFVGITEEQAQAAVQSPTCEVLVAWDAGLAPQLLQPGEPYQP